MPIGFDAGDRGGTVPPVATPRVGPTPLEGERATPTTRPVTAVRWTIWRTHGDDRVCPLCGPLDGRAWPEDGGPQPPLHPGCRCTRTPGWTEWWRA